MNLQGTLLEARRTSSDYDTQPAREPQNPYQALWKHARLMHNARSDHPASLQAAQLCRRLLYETENMQALKERRPPKHTPTDLEQKLDADIMMKGYTAALNTYKDPATAMQHLLYCMMQELRVVLTTS